MDSREYVRTQGRDLRCLVSDNSNAVKAILIILVGIDHNDWFRQLSPTLFKPLTFHVLGFFFLAFTFGSKRLDVDFLLDRLCRYLVPFWVFLTIASVAYQTLILSTDSFTSIFIAWFLAALTGNTPFVKSASGLMMLWFLPCLFSLTCLLAAFDSVRSRFARLLIWIFSVFAHLSIPLFDVSRMMWIPFGLGISANIFVLGLVWRWFLSQKFTGGLVATYLIVLVISYGALMYMSINVEIGALDVYGINRPLLMLLQDFAGFTGVLVVVWVAAKLPRLAWIDAIGRQSLLIYLIHPFAYQACTVIASRTIVGAAHPLVVFIWACLTTCFAIWAAYLAANWVSTSPRLSPWITPRTWRTWPPVRILSRV